MRLISCRNEDELLEMHEFVGGPDGYNFPPYAILSHTWGPGEVKFNDLKERSGKSKQGYEKIKFCRSQAMRDGLSFFWIDTCCIDKSSSSELSEAINSMFKWFASARRCYVYLADVSSSEGSGSSDKPLGWVPAFRRSRWFTRGWTLQELLAPQSVEFFSREGNFLGDKISLQETIHEITGIPTDALNNSKLLGGYSVSEKMTWAADRNTARIEDRAYCLMGLFDINMPLLYGEGDGAFQRLQKEIMSLADQISGLRLLNVETNPLVIETFALQDQPPYAIFSHTWGTEEISYQDILLGKGPGKKGYEKIRHCCEQTARLGFKYLWVDTCCIDKKSSAELQEAICSMYTWYKNAQICFVYLEDHKLSTTPAAQLSTCRWFKRGWTLRMCMILVARITLVY
jgi:hypothetical protein